MIEDLKKMLSEIEEAIHYAEESDIADTYYYSRLCKQRRILKRTLKQIAKAQGRPINVRCLW